MSAPTKEGFYWAKWMIADDHLPEPYAPFKTWEPVEVYLNDDGEKPAELRVCIVGHDFNQALDCFHWGDRIEPPVDKAQALKVDLDKIKAEEAAERYRKMTPYERVEFIQNARRRQET